MARDGGTRAAHDSSGLCTLRSRGARAPSPDRAEPYQEEHERPAPDRAEPYQEEGAGTQPETQGTYCPRCGAFLSPGDRFCFSCGAASPRR
ncbi:zinc ribbon domain-containing protein [Streptomyces sp. S1D4-11]|nr:zinc ribbon domain-containing protein [Streptomyces sp. S1D4-11]